MGEKRDELWSTYCPHCDLSFDVWVEISEAGIPATTHDALLCPSCLLYCPGPKPKENLT